MTASPPPLIDGPALLAAWPPRARDSHKGTHGHVLVLGGSAGMRGAAVLAAQAALWTGAGRVSLLFADGGGPEYLPGLPELLRPAAPELTRLLEECVVLAGPGMGLEPAARLLYAQVCQSSRRLVLDADALTLLSEQTDALRAPPDGQQRLLTPHPGEAARLLGSSSASIQSDRAGSALSIARIFGATLVLKGADSLVATPAGDLWANPSGNPGMAAAGMGDTLAGMLAALLAQGLPPSHAMPLAVWLHGAAADLLVSEGTGPRGLTASEVGLAARRLINASARWPGPAPL